ncbi:ATP-dependent DNA helicase [Aphis craccivora]|uniref:ATP-dependent DNA helicase n=1 Tax=Aphis craccivora TaxID=307492 RepID=A0A6G0XYV8_APHCR|nr:ATP-dependent DNA helicase [Aphis craccivora]
MVCSTCKSALKKQKIPIFLCTMVSNTHHCRQIMLPLDVVTERLISPRIPFMQIRRLRHVHGQYSIYGLVINVPVSVNSMVNILPRDIDDEHCITYILREKYINLVSCRV